MLFYINVLRHKFGQFFLLFSIFSFGNSVKLETFGLWANSLKKVKAGPLHQYSWPMARGPIGSHSTSMFQGPHNLTKSLAWTWHHPENKFLNKSNGASLFDDEGNVYSGFWSGIRKFSPDGQMLWHHPLHGDYNDIPALMDGALYTTTFDGHVIAVSMETGKLIWKSDQVCTWQSNTTGRCHNECDCHRIGTDIGSVIGHKGVIVVRTHEPPGGGACRVAGLDAKTGAFLWDYASAHLIWNFYPIINDNGHSFLFQDSTGGVYHLGFDGKQIWKAGIPHETWKQTFTDGGLQLGSNGVVYAVKAYGNNRPPGTVRAYRVSDGKFLWESHKMPFAPNSWPAVGRMHKDDRLTVMAPFGLCDTRKNGLDLTPGIWGLDAETGKLMWRWDGPTWHKGPFHSEFVERVPRHHENRCLQNLVGNPTLDAHGHLYFGLLDGMVYELARDSSGPAIHVVSSFNAEAAFTNSGISVASGTMALASYDTLFMFKRSKEF